MRSSPLLLLLLTGCPTVSDKDDTSGTGDDTGDTDTDIQYDPGCITIDGGGGYAHLADAVTVAPEGAVIELCEGTYEESLTVDKAVTIRGASATGVTLAGPGSDVPLTITGAGVTVENLTLESPRTALVLDGASGASLSQITISVAGSWAVTSRNATSTFDGLTITQPGAGGVQVSGGSLEISNGLIEYPASFGLEISDDAAVTLNNTSIVGTLMLSDDVSDGYAVSVDGASLTMSDSNVSGADGIGIYGVDADISLIGSTIADAIYLGVFAFDSTYDFSGVSITGSTLQGVYLDGPEVSLSDTTVSTLTGTSCSLEYAEWGQEGNPWCGGINIAGDNVTLSGIAVSGYENYGLIVQPNDEDVTTLTLDGATIDDVGRWGAYMVYVEGTLTGLSVTNTREPELADPCAGYIDQSNALLSIYSDIVVDGATFSGNAGWGFSSLIGTATITGSTFDGNNCIGLVNYQAEMNVSGSTFTNGGSYGSVYDSQGVLVLENNLFSNNHAGYSVSYDYTDSGGYIYTYSTSGGDGTDLTAYLSGAIYVTNNTFEDGDDSLIIQQAGIAEVTGNTWTGYEGSLAYFYQPSSDSPAVFMGNSADDVVGPVVQAAYGPVEVFDNTVGSTRASEPVEVSYSYDYEDDTLDYASSYTYTSSSAMFYVSGYYYDDGAGSITEWPGSMSIEDLEVGSSYSTLFSVYDAELDVEGVVVGDVGGYLLSASWSSFAPDVEVSDLEAGMSTYQPFYLSNSFASGGSVSLSGVTLAGTGSDGISATAIGAIELEDVDFGDVAGTGISVATRTYDYSYTYDSTTGTYTYTYTDIDAETAITGSNVRFSSTGSDALVQSGGSVAIDGLTVEASGGDAVRVEGLTALSLSNASLSNPTGAGVVASDTYSAYSYETGTYATLDADTVATLSNVTVTGAGDDAFSFTGGSVTMTGNTASGSAYSGLALSEVTADIQGNSFTSNTEYGMVCETVTLSACATNVLTDNVLGPHLDCSDACAE